MLVEKHEVWNSGHDICTSAPLHVCFLGIVKRVIAVYCTRTRFALFFPDKVRRYNACYLFLVQRFPLLVMRLYSCPRGTLSRGCLLSTFHGMRLPGGQNYPQPQSSTEVPCSVISGTGKTEINNSGITNEAFGR